MEALGQGDFPKDKRDTQLSRQTVDVNLLNVARRRQAKCISYGSIYVVQQ